MTPVASSGIAATGSAEIDETVGFWKFGTVNRSAQAASVTTAPAATVIMPALRFANMRLMNAILEEVRSCEWLFLLVIGRVSISDVDAEQERARRRERSEVDEADDVLVAEVVYFGIEAPILRPGVQVAAAERQARIARARQEALREARRDRIRERDFAQLHVRTVVDVLAGVTARVPLVVAVRTERLPDRRVRRRLVVIPRVAAFVEQIVRHVRHVATLTPVEQRIDGQAVEVEIVAERHLEVRV